MTDPTVPPTTGLKFTLPEVIVILLILLVFLILIITFYEYSHIAKNETTAVESLRTILSTESAWRQTDMDGNGFPDFWTADVWGLYACADHDGRLTRGIPLTLAKSDRDPADLIAGFAGPRPYFAEKPPADPIANNGYLLEALVKTDEGVPYAADGEDKDTKALESYSRFGFAALPESYGTTRKNYFIVNEEGVIYAHEAGSLPPVNTTNWPPPEDPPLSSPTWHILR